MWWHLRVTPWTEDFSQLLDLTWRVWGGTGSIAVTNIHHPCVIWVPTELARTKYLTQTTFHPSPLASQGLVLATAGDVNPDLTTYGYRFSTKPPAYVPDIDYSSYGEPPLYPFAGQMVPGTNVQYVDPAIPPVWLVDIVNVAGQDVVVPALTSIDFAKFKSINWPRERYVVGVLQAPGISDQNHILMGFEQTPNRIISGVNYVHGDYAIIQPANVSVERGSLFVLKASSDWDLNWPGAEGKIDIVCNSDMGSQP